MTLQIGLVGSNGIILASDTCMTKFNDRARDSSNISTKIFVEGYHAIAFADDDSTRLVAKTIRDRLNNGDFSFSDVTESLESLANGIYTEEAERWKDTGWHPLAPRRVLAILNGKLWRLEIGPRSNAYQITNRTVTGDDSNLARFFSELYFDIRKPVAELKFLAAHVISMGHKLASLYISGLEMLIYSNSSLTRVASAEIQALQARSEALHQTISQEIYRV